MEGHNAVAKKERKEIQAMIYKTLNRKLKIEQHDPYTKQGGESGDVKQ